MDDHDLVSEVDEFGNEASGCPVDRGCLQGLGIGSAISDLRHRRVRFTGGQALAVRVANNRGKPVLAFIDPFKRG